ncbi:hypothetical protein HFO65_36750 [Rhizobium laguerreae]|uniref:hypothetical protein n=1 Tax=Rhizobium laguerreae TaxID=1076926 RepID=UPI001C91F8CE|nr:hypothetical protein [Rhizobium laguerreae]MBY3143969.1 hypothetical protein [Rhizobium laguerreae]MBY3166086.1 hypothetical protein [Rhizobium laguerreae]MBY3266991.1 hypothetical protein [Rhizobium laguerreae]MBY3342127.1 hypothetical protein [Rhizobium laguerreae]
MSGVVGIALPKVAEIGGWNDFQTLMVESALGSVIEINKAATADFQAAMDKFNDAEALRQAAGFSRDVDLAASRQVQFSKGNAATDFLQSDDLGQILEQARAAVDAMYAERAQAYVEAIQQAAAAREAQAAKAATNRAASSNGRSKNVRKSYNAQQCQIDRDQLEFAREHDTMAMVQQELADLRQGNCP